MNTDTAGIRPAQPAGLPSRAAGETPVPTPATPTAPASIGIPPKPKRSRPAAKAKRKRPAKRLSAAEIKKLNAKRRRAQRAKKAAATPPPPPPVPAAPAVPAKRGRGRPPLDPNAPRKRGRPPGSGRKAKGGLLAALDALTTCRTALDKLKPAERADVLSILKG